MSYRQLTLVLFSLIGVTFCLGAAIGQHKPFIAAGLLVVDVLLFFAMWEDK